MMISWERKFIFVHVYKTGGTSVEYALFGALSRQERLWRRLSDNLERRGLPQPSWWLRVPSIPQHATAKDIREAVPSRIFDEYFKFGFVRNPWSLQLSLYHYALSNPAHPQHYIFQSFSNFETYLEWLATRPNGPHTEQSSFLMDDGGKLLVDFVGRFENVAADFAGIADRIGSPRCLPHLNRGGYSEDYRSIYSPQMRDIVADLHRTDIEAFGYKF